MTSKIAIKSYRACGKILQVPWDQTTKDSSSASYWKRQCQRRMTKMELQHRLVALRPGGALEPPGLGAGDDVPGDLYHPRGAHGPGGGLHDGGFVLN